jgi:hypothetical protein
MHVVMSIHIIYYEKCINIFDTKPSQKRHFPDLGINGTRISKTNLKEIWHELRNGRVGYGCGSVIDFCKDGGVMLVPQEQIMFCLLELRTFSQKTLYYGIRKIDL